MTIQELREKRVKAWDAAKAFLDAHRTDKGTLSAEDDTVYARMEQDITDLGKEIARMERLEDMDKQMSRATSTPLTTKPESAKPDTKVGRASDAYAKAFWDQARKRDSLEIRNALQVGTDSEGGYLVPDTFEKTLISALGEENIIRKHSHVFRTSGGDHKIPVVSSKGTAAWVEEESAIPESDDAFGQLYIGAHKVATLIKVSEELLQDSAFDLETYFRTEFAKRIGNKEEDAFLNGNGTSKPTGILHSTGGADVGITTASSTAITADEVIDLYYSLKAPYRKNAIWVMNETTVKAIRKLRDGNGNYLWQPGLRESDSDTLLGVKIYTTPFAPEIAAGAKTIAFGDFSYYWIGDRSGITFKRLNELYAGTGQVGFLASKRVDGKLTLTEAIKVLQQKA